MRKYTVTPKVLAACRANLARANAVAREIRFRSTPRRRAACRANLLKAFTARKASRSPAYGCFRLGLGCVSLERSLAMAGEDRVEFDAHRELFERAFAPRTRVERRLVRGMAETVWRRLRAFRGQARWERRSLEFRLDQAARSRFPTPDPIFPLLVVDRDQLLAEEVLGILANDFTLFAALRKTNDRFERLSRLFLAQRDPEAQPLAFFTRPRVSECALLEQPGAALHNPFLSARCVARALDPKPPRLKPWREWNWRVDAARQVSDGADDAGGDSATSRYDLPGQGAALRYGLFTVENSKFEIRNWGLEGRIPRAGLPAPF